MDRPSAVNQLPIVHAVAIRLKDNGYDDRAIAAAAGIDEHEVAMLLQVAERKLTNLIGLETATSPLADASDPSESGRPVG